MIRAYFYNADCADAFRLEYLGDDEKMHNIMIDGGFSATYRRILRDEINRMDCIDLWIVTHLHDDHINGVVSYLREVRQTLMPDKVQRWFYNIPRTADMGFPTSDISVAAGNRSNDILTGFLMDSGKSTSDVLAGMCTEIAGLKIEVLSPDTSRLNALHKKYARPGTEFERLEDDSISSPMAAKTDDYHIALEHFSLDTQQEDDNIENGSSIAILTSYDGKRILWLSDAHPSAVTAALSDLGFHPGNPLHCDIVKMAHHGSKLNNSLALFEIIKCTNYVFSTNGANRHYLPSKLTIARLLLNPARDVLKERYSLYFTSDNKTLRGIFTSDPPDVFERLNFEVIYNSSNAIALDV